MTAQERENSSLLHTVDRTIVPFRMLRQISRDNFCSKLLKSAAGGERDPVKTGTFKLRGSPMYFQAVVLSSWKCRTSRLASAPRQPLSLNGS